MKICADHWHQLSDEKKEILRKWMVLHNYGLDIIQSETAETCDYAALLSNEQMKQFLTEEHVTNIPEGLNTEQLWQEVKDAL